MNLGGLPKSRPLLKAGGAISGSGRQKRANSVSVKRRKSKVSESGATTANDDEPGCPRRPPARTKSHPGPKPAEHVTVCIGGLL